ncbi:MAG TPA: hypothetical protein D7I03_01565 [Candidatus Poseidoniales archaeon]|nr:MAG TPA: hypothetical protein D7I03_01565 [Candidatus Poseidoniales archaeon]HII50010.1 hypothetical protein [Candidatus Poseidoniaceae archaeon]
MAMIANWVPNKTCKIWKGDEDTYFNGLKIQHRKQVGPSCVATTLSMIVESLGFNASPEHFKAVTNSQCPQSWSDSLKPFGLQLAYCNTDVRRLKYYVEELALLKDLFLVSFYSTDPPFDIDSNGKLCTAHIVTMHKDMIYDTAKLANYGGVSKVQNYTRLDRPVKRIFRVVPLGHERCL